MASSRKINAVQWLRWLTGLAKNGRAMEFVRSGTHGVAEWNSFMSSCITFLSSWRNLDLTMMNVTFSFLETIKWEPHNAKSIGVIILGIISLSIIRISPIPHLPDQLYVTQWVTAGQQWESWQGLKACLIFSFYCSQLFIYKVSLCLRCNLTGTTKVTWIILSTRSSLSLHPLSVCCLSDMLAIL